MKRNRLAKIPLQKPRFDLDSFIPSGFVPSTPRPVKQNLACTEVPNSVGPECVPESPAQIEAAAPESLAETSPSPSANEPAAQPKRATDAPSPLPASSLQPLASTVQPVYPENPPAANSKGRSSSSLTSNHSPLTSASHHGRLCTVCSHPLRDAIEADFLRWRSPEEITREYRLRSRTSIYRHANATGLFRRRKEQFARVLEYFLEQAETCSLEDADVVIRAARIYAHLNHDGKWVESPRTNYIYHGPAPLPPEELALPDHSDSSREAGRGFSALRQTTALVLESSVPKREAKKNQKAKQTPRRAAAAKRRRPRLIGTRGN